VGFSLVDCSATSYATNDGCDGEVHALVLRSLRAEISAIKSVLIVLGLKTQEINYVGLAEETSRIASKLVELLAR
jgi:hypothetical protein